MRPKVRKAAQTAAPFAVGALLWWMWDIAFTWPPTNSGLRLATSIMAGCALAAVSSLAVWSWRRRRQVPAVSGNQPIAAKSPTDSALSNKVDIGAGVADSTLVVGNNNVLTIHKSAGKSKHLDSEAYATYLMQASQERTRQRLLVAGLIDDDLAMRVIVMLSQRALPEAIKTLQPGKLVVLTGELGAGKSEYAEKWHREGISAWRNGTGAIPVWTTGKIAVDRLEELIVEACGGETALRERGCDLVLDELDALANPRTIETLLDDAAVLARSRGNIRVVATARPGYPMLQDREIRVPLLKPDEASDVVATIAGLQPWQLSGTLTEEAQNATRTPLYAVLVGVELTNLPRPFSRPWLLNRLAERALDTVTRRTGLHVKREDTASALRKIAVGNIVGIPETSTSLQLADKLIDSQVVSEGLNGQLRIPLAVLEQFFAAQALLRDVSLIDRVVTDAAIVTTWRYPLSMALAIGSRHKVSMLLDRIVRQYPGIGSWLVSESLAVSGRERQAEGNSSDPATPESVGSRERALEVGQAVWESLEAWLEGLPELRNKISLVGSDGKLRPLGFAVGTQGTYEAIWAPEGSEYTDVFWLREARFPTPTLPGLFLPPGWGPMRSGPQSEAAGWPWYWTRNCIRAEIEQILSQRRLEPRAEEFLELERDWRLARSVLAQKDVLHTPIEPTRILGVITAMRNQTGTGDLPASVRFQGDNWRYTNADVRRLESRCLDLKKQGRLIERPAPIPDATVNPVRPIRWVWDLYSNDQLRDLVEHVWRQALIGYVELVVDHFSQFGRTLRLMALGRFKVDGVLLIGEGSGPEGSPGLDYTIYSSTPHVNLDNAPPLTPGDPVPEPNIRIQLDTSGQPPSDPLRIYERSKVIPRGVLAAAYGNTMGADTSLDVFGDTPATLLAYRWLGEDLTRLGWVEHLPYGD